MRISREGHGPRGDLLVIIRVKKHEFLVRDGNDIHMTVSIPLSTAILGGEVDVPSLSMMNTLGRNSNSLKTRKIRIHKGTKPNTKIVLNGEGATDPETGKTGHFYVWISIKIPEYVYV